MQKNLADIWRENKLINANVSVLITKKLELNNNAHFPTMIFPVLFFFRWIFAEQDDYLTEGIPVQMQIVCTSILSNRLLQTRYFFPSRGGMHTLDWVQIIIVCGHIRHCTYHPLIFKNRRKNPHYLLINKSSSIGQNDILTAIKYSAFLWNLKSNE